MKFIPILFAMAISLLGAVRLAAVEISPASVLTLMQRVADWQLANPSAHKPTQWIQGAGDAGMMALAEISGDAKYRDAMLAMGAANGWQLGTRMYHADDQCVGQTYAELYFLYRDPKMIAPMRERFDAILAKPSDAPSLDFALPDKKYLEQWSWADSLFMAPPTWLRLYAATNDKRYLDFAVTNWWRTTDYLFDKDEHLFFRDSTYFKKTEANGEKVFWSRGNGWVLAGLVRVLQYLPTNHPDRLRFEQLFKNMAEKILSCQQRDGLWHASLLDPDSYPIKETSGSGFFTYAFAWGVNQGLLDRAKFEPAVRKGWTALTGCVDADGKLAHVQPIGADPKNFDADSTEPYGVGAFLLAGSEVYRMAVLQLPIFETNKLFKEEFVFPVVLFSKANIALPIRAFAEKIGINYNFDERLNYGRVDKNGVTNSGPIISARWTQVPAYSALKMTLANCGLKMVRDSGENTYRIIAANSDEHFASSPIIIRVTNPANFRRDSETIEISYYDFLPHAPDSIQDSFPFNFVVMDGMSAHIIDSQVYTVEPRLMESKTKYDKLLFQVDLAPGETRTFYILDASALAAVPTPIVKTFARYVPERHDDFAWESDRIAHRMFGKALETWQQEPLTSSGVDVWIKRTRNLIVNQMYGTGVYYDTNGVSQDDYKVGKTRGDGGLGIWDGQKLSVSANWRNWKIITTGPIRSEFELTYDAWDAGGRQVSETKRISIDAGSNLSRVKSTFSSDDKSLLQIGVGLAERPGENTILEDRPIIKTDLQVNPWWTIDKWQSSTDKGLVVQNQDEGWMTYWQPQDFTKGTTAVAFVLPKGSIETFTNDIPNLPTDKLAPPTHTVTEGQPAVRNLLAIAPAEIGKPFIYYLGAGWDQSGDFPDAKSWNDYVRRFAERRDQPLQVTIGN
jgi:rhamnogalacturonyl hydrolase YesR